jgi:hypothetical protein
MLINKITAGYVMQTYNTETGKCESQEFIAGDECEYECSETEEDHIQSGSCASPCSQIAGVRQDWKTGQYVPTINGKDTSPTSFDEYTALRIAQEQIAFANSDETYDEFGVNTKNSFNTPPKQ